MQPYLVRAVLCAHVVEVAQVEAAEGAAETQNARPEAQADGGLRHVARWWAADAVDGVQHAGHAPGFPGFPGFPGVAGVPGLVGLHGRHGAD